MNVFLEDSSGVVWLLAVTTGGLLTTTATVVGAAQPFYLSDSSGNTWLIGVTTGGLLTTTQEGPPGQPLFVTLQTIPYQAIFNLSVLTSGLLQTVPAGPVGVAVWEPNGFAAGTDNSVVGGGGGFLAYPQPPFPVGVGPEANGQFGPLYFTYDSSTATAKGNMFTISNPGRNG